MIAMNVEMLVDQTVMQHLALFGCVKNMDAFAQHMLKTSEHPVLRFRRQWMRKVALKQHLEAEQRQKQINDQRKARPDAKLSDMRREAVIDPHLSAEMLHYNDVTWNDKNFVGAVRAEAPAIFVK